MNELNATGAASSDERLDPNGPEPMEPDIMGCAVRYPLLNRSGY
jgi:hypothetical protein